MNSTFVPMYVDLQSAWLILQDFLPSLSWSLLKQNLRSTVEGYSINKLVK